MKTLHTLLERMGAVYCSNPLARKHLRKCYQPQGAWSLVLSSLTNNLNPLQSSMSRIAHIRYRRICRHRFSMYGVIKRRRHVSAWARNYVSTRSRTYPLAMVGPCSKDIFHKNDKRDLTWLIGKDMGSDEGISPRVNLS
jgi:hypothetical protein